MKLKIDNKYQIVSDSMQYILQEQKETVEGKNKGDKYVVNVGYYGKICKALQAYKELEIRNSDVNTVVELMELLKRLDNKIEDFLLGN